MDLPAIRQPVWLDCDPGHDDAFAIVLAAGHDSLELLGVSTVHGNASLDRTTENARSILTAIGRSEIPVFKGAAKPFCRGPVHAPDIHGSTGIDGTDLLPIPDQRAVRDTPAVTAIYDALRQQPQERAWIVATGALTNVAALFAIYPHLAEHIRGLCVMGGAVGGGFTTAPMGTIKGEGERIGNITAFAEFNIYASHQFLASKTTLVPLDLTHQVLATKVVQDRLMNHHNPGTLLSITGGPTRLRRMLHDLLNYFAKTYANVFGIIEGPPLHDPLAVAAVLDFGGSRNKFSYGTEEFWHVSIVTDGQHLNEGHGSGRGTTTSQDAMNQVGRTIINPASVDRNGRIQGVRIPRSVNVEWFWNALFSAIDNADSWIVERKSEGQGSERDL